MQHLAIFFVDHGQGGKRCVSLVVNHDVGEIENEVKMSGKEIDDRWRGIAGLILIRHDERRDFPFLRCESIRVLLKALAARLVQ